MTFFSSKERKSGRNNFRIDLFLFPLEEQERKKNNLEKSSSLLFGSLCLSLSIPINSACLVPHYISPFTPTVPFDALTLHSAHFHWKAYYVKSFVTNCPFCSTGKWEPLYGTWLREKGKIVHPFPVPGRGMSSSRMKLSGTQRNCSTVNKYNFMDHLRELALKVLKARWVMNAE